MDRDELKAWLRLTLSPGGACCTWTGRAAAARPQALPGFYQHPSEGPPHAPAELPPQPYPRGERIHEGGYGPDAPALPVGPQPPPVDNQHHGYQAGTAAQQEHEDVDGATPERGRLIPCPGR